MANPADGVTIWGSLQCPYYVHKALVTLFGLPAEKIRVIQAETGGGFGGKEEYPSMIAGHAALLAWKSGKPVKIIYDRAEDMVATTKRHPSRTRHRTGVTRDGKLVAMDIDFVIDGGAYATLSSVVLSRGTIHAAGPYFCPNVRVHSRAVATNAPPHGAFRGFGAPQSYFRDGAPHRSGGARRESDAGRISPPKFYSQRPDDRHRTTDPRGREFRRPARSRVPGKRLPRQARALRAGKSRRNDQARHRLRVLHARSGIYRLGRSLSGVGRGTRSDARKATSAFLPPAPKSARGRTRSFRKLPRTRSASATIASKSRSRIRAPCRTAARPSRRARRWSSASWWRPPRSA